MVPLLKVAAIGAAGAGLCCLGWWISSQEGVPPLRDLSTDSDFETADGKTYHNKFATDYAKYFVGVGTAKTGTAVSSINNDPWWEWALKNRYQTYSSIKKKGFENKNTAKDLKEACKNAYKADSGKVKEKAAEGEYEESNVWIFCSIGGNKPKSISETLQSGSTPATTSFEGNTTDNKLLISTTDSNNDWFWQIKEAEFFGASSYPTGLGDESSNDSKFKNIHKEKEKYKDFTHFQIKKLCGESYKENSNTSQAFPRKAVFKFCSLSGKEPVVAVQTQGPTEETPK